MPSSVAAAAANVPPAAEQRRSAFGGGDAAAKSSHWLRLIIGAGAADSNRCAAADADSMDGGKPVDRVDEARGPFKQVISVNDVGAVAVGDASGARRADEPGSALPGSAGPFSTDSDNNMNSNAATRPRQVSSHERSVRLSEERESVMVQLAVGEQGDYTAQYQQPPLKDATNSTNSCNALPTTSTSVPVERRRRQAAPNPRQSRLPMPPVLGPFPWHWLAERGQGGEHPVVEQQRRLPHHPLVHPHQRHQQHRYTPSSGAAAQRQFRRAARRAARQDGAAAAAAAAPSGATPVVLTQWRSRVEGAAAAADATGCAAGGQNSSDRAPIANIDEQDDQCHILDHVADAAASDPPLAGNLLLPDHLQRVYGYHQYPQAVTYHRHPTPGTDPLVTNVNLEAFGAVPARKGCCSRLSHGTLVRLFIALISGVGLCCVALGITLGAATVSGSARLTLCLLMIGVGAILVTVAAVAWHLSTQQANRRAARSPTTAAIHHQQYHLGRRRITSHGAGAGDWIGRLPRWICGRNGSRADRHSIGGQATSTPYRRFGSSQEMPPPMFVPPGFFMPEFLWRPPPPSYQATVGSSAATNNNNANNSTASNRPASNSTQSNPNSTTRPVPMIGPIIGSPPPSYRAGRARVGSNGIGRAVGQRVGDAEGDTHSVFSRPPSYLSNQPEDNQIVSTPEPIRPHVLTVNESTTTTQTEVDPSCMESDTRILLANDTLGAASGTRLDLAHSQEQTYGRMSAGSRHSHLSVVDCSRSEPVGFAVRSCSGDQQRQTPTYNTQAQHDVSQQTSPSHEENGEGSPECRVVNDSFTYYI